MNDFDYDVLQKKRIAQQARHRKGTRGKRGCTMLSDYLTPKQLKERNGPLMTVKLNKPMKWEQFKKLSATLKVEYLTHLKEKYHPTMDDMSKMLDVSATTLRSMFQNLKFRLGYKGTISQEARDKHQTEWNMFLNGGAEKAEESPEEKTIEEAVEKAINAMDFIDIKSPRSAQVMSGSFNCKGTPGEIVKFVEKLRNMLGEDKTYMLTINLREEPTNGMEGKNHESK